MYIQLESYHVNNIPNKGADAMVIITKLKWDLNYEFFIPQNHAKKLVQQALFHSHQTQQLGVVCGSQFHLSVTQVSSRPIFTLIRRSSQPSWILREPNVARPLHALNLHNRIPLEPPLKSAYFYLITRIIKKRLATRSKRLRLHCISEKVSYIHLSLPSVQITRIIHEYQTQVCIPHTLAQVL